MNKHSKNIAVFVDMLDLQSLFTKATGVTEHLRWDEDKRFYGPLNRSDLGF